jgi:AraC-like DNA-binding protein
MDIDLSSKALGHFAFSTASHPRREGFEAWAQQVAPLFQTAPVSDPPSYRAELDGFLLDEIIIGRTRFDAQRYRRDRQLAAGVLQDNYLVQLYVEGGFAGEADDRPVAVRAGDVCVFDLAGTLATEAAPSACVSLVIPKRLIDHRWNAAASVNGLMLPGDSLLGQLLGAHLVALARGADKATAAEAPYVADATAQLVASVMACSRAADLDPSPLRLALFQRAAAFIRANLRSAKLSPHLVGTALNVSRAQLYRAFERVGGVNHFIQRQRLALARRELCDPLHRRETIGAIAYRCGFSSEAHFSTLFRETSRPRELRDLPQSDPQPLPAGGLPGLLELLKFQLAAE